RSFEESNTSKAPQNSLCHGSWPRGVRPRLCSMDLTRVRRPPSAQSESRKKAQGPPDPYPQRFGPAGYTPACVSHQPRGLLRRTGQRARPDRVLSARTGAGRRRARTRGDAEEGDDEGRDGPDEGSRPFLVDRRMLLLTLTVLAAFA